MYQCYACGKEIEKPGELCPFCKFPVISTLHGDAEEEKKIRQYAEEYRQANPKYFRKMMSKAASAEKTEEEKTQLTVSEKGNSSSDKKKSKKKKIIISVIIALIVLSGIGGLLYYVYGITDEWWILRYPKQSPVALNTANVGDIVMLGSYEQDNKTNNGKEPIEWVVLAKENGRLLVVSRYALDFGQYGAKYGEEVTWETSPMRTWLNTDFFESAFSVEESQRIPEVTVQMDKNPEYDCDPGNDTKDKIFLLSYTDVAKYFSSEKARKCLTTDYGKSVNREHKKSCYWFLRTTGSRQSNVLVVDPYGAIVFLGFYVDNNMGVRPAMWIEL